AVKLNQMRGFEIKESLIAGFTSGIKTNMSQQGYQSYIEGNYTMDCDTAINFDNSNHDSLYITCNRIEFKDFGIYSINSILKDFVTASTGPGNIFINISYLDQNHFIEHTGNPVTYFYDPQYSSTYSGGFQTNITTSGAASDRYCASITTETCQIW